MTIWVRKAYNSKMKEQAAWIKAVTLESGTANRLEVGSDCKSVVSRTDEQPVHQCYKWRYSAACQVRSHQSVGPTPEPQQCAPGRSGVEGDMSKSCEYETPHGMCKARYAGLAFTCLRRWRSMSSRVSAQYCAATVSQSTLSRLPKSSYQSV